ncbi:MAG: F0F1 ATP synthase subunit B [Candidatus Saccharimonadales bacterium]
MSVKFAESDQAATGGISALGLNLKEFLFQLVTFALVLLILRRYVFPKLVATLESRRETLENSLVNAKETEAALQEAEAKAAQLLRQARGQADEALASAQTTAREIIDHAEAAGAEQAARILKEAETIIEQERRRLREQLKTELTDLVILATEKVIKEKVDPKKDAALISRAAHEVAK